MSTIVAAGNVLTPAYLALQQRGYAVRTEKTGTEDELWFAETEARRFVAGDPLSLLGLVAFYETRGDDWQATDEEIVAYLSLYPAGHPLHPATLGLMDSSRAEHGECVSRWSEGGEPSWTSLARRGWIRLSWK
ncbi:MAG TPA: hypothetical protein VK689_21505 [Armatimonadota bacterium]|nr:hypothetical protein [Armatimonadota bacterium]